MLEKQQKDSILKRSKQHLNNTRACIKYELKKKQVWIKDYEQDKIQTASSADELVVNKLAAHNYKRLDELATLYPSPYFVKLRVYFDHTKEEKDIYLAKFSFTEESIFSWVAPAAQVRFEEIGKFKYQLPEGKWIHGELLMKEQFMIANGEIKYLSSESNKYDRTLIYQEYLSKQPKGFQLKEIVQQMEKMQDKVIRSHYKGSFLISGPAGSGKTTLGLHRVAYLCLSPDTMEKFPEDSILVLVQDDNSKEYFTKLLPEIGINNVNITIFAEWALGHLGLENLKYIDRIGETEIEKTVYEFQKLEILKELQISTTNLKSFDLLDYVYSQAMTSRNYQIFKKQKELGQLDRYDLTILLQFKKESDNGLLKKDYFYQKERGKKTLKKVEKLVNYDYSLVIIDEVQNYLPGQLSLLKTIVSEKTEAMLYIGDLKQQTKVGAIQSWNQINENFEISREAKLEKVYRNSKQIMHYIKSLGYNVVVSDKLKSGKPVEEITLSDKQQEIEFIKEYIQDSENKVIGIIGLNEDYIDDFKKCFGQKSNIHVFTYVEAQGVEFDQVFIVGINKELYKIPDSLSEINYKQAKAVQKNLVYVGLTRAISELYLLGRDRLGDILKF